VKAVGTTFEQVPKIDKDIRMTVPTDYLHKRKKVPEASASARKAARENAAAAAASQNAEMLKKSSTIQT